MKKLLLFITLFIGVISFAQTLSKNLSSLSKDDLKGFRVEHDDFKKTTFISKKGWGFQDWYAPYLSINKGNLQLRWVLKYRGSGWLFMDKVSIIVNGQTYSFPIDPFRDVISGSEVSEIADIIANDYIINILREISKTETMVKFRFEGKNSRDYVLAVNGANKIGEVITLYDKLKK